MFQPSLTLSQADINAAVNAWANEKGPSVLLANPTYKARRGENEAYIGFQISESNIIEAIEAKLNTWAGTNVKYDIELGETRDGWTANAVPRPSAVINNAAPVVDPVVEIISSPVTAALKRAADIADVVLAEVPLVETVEPADLVGASVEENEDDRVEDPPFDLSNSPVQTLEAAPATPSIFRRAPQT